MLELHTFAYEISFCYGEIFDLIESKFYWALKKLTWLGLEPIILYPVNNIPLYFWDRHRARFPEEI